MALSLRFPLLLAGAVASAISLAPAAAAEPGREDTRDSSSSAAAGSPSATSSSGARAGSTRNQAGARNQTGKGQLSTDYTSKDLPTGWKNDAVWARPGASNPFGSGPKPPVVALD